VKAPITKSPPKALTIARAALEKKASDVLILDVGDLTSIAEYLVFGSGESERQVIAIANHIEREMTKQFQAHPQIEGSATATWILLDYGDIVVHVFRQDVRTYYALEKMWADAPLIPIPETIDPSSLERQTTLPAVPRYGS